MTARVFQVGIALALLGETLLLLVSVQGKRWTRFLPGRSIREADHAADPSDGMRVQFEIHRGRGRWRRLDVRPLHPAERNWFLQSWRRVQVRFAAAPDRAIDDADRLVTKVMEQRGYPTHRFGRRRGSPAPKFALVMKGFQAAHAIWLASERGDATPEDLRQAMAHYRSLFEQLMDLPESRPVIANSWSDVSRRAAESPPRLTGIQGALPNVSTNGGVASEQVQVPAQMRGERPPA